MASSIGAPLHIPCEAAVSNAFGNRAAFWLNLTCFYIAVQPTAHGIGNDAADGWVLFLEEHRNARIGAASAGRGCPAINLAACLGPYFCCGPFRNGPDDWPSFSKLICPNRVV